MYTSDTPLQVTILTGQQTWQTPLYKQTQQTSSDVYGNTYTANLQYAEGLSKSDFVHFTQQLRQSVEGLPGCILAG